MKGSKIIMRKYSFEAAQFCDAIRELASKPENLQNLESYLEWNFDNLRRWKYENGITLYKPAGGMLAGFSLLPYVSIALA